MLSLHTDLQVKGNVTYIVAGVLWTAQEGEEEEEERNKVLLIQEAKASCRGRWYLPAGRVEPNESFVVRTLYSCCAVSSISFTLESLSGPFFSYFSLSLLLYPKPTPPVFLSSNSPSLSFCFFSFNHLLDHCSLYSIS